jgi:hypothetical protein
MTRRNSQGFWTPGKATVRFPSGMRLAASERERLWKGLERFVNCGDSESDYRALSQAFWGFWPMLLCHLPLQDSRIFESLESDEPLVPLSDAELEQDKPTMLNWDANCHKLFLFYRDTLRDVWSGKETTDWFDGGRAEFLLGLNDLNEKARQQAEQRAPSPKLDSPFELYESWSEIVAYFPTAEVIGEHKFEMIWDRGAFSLAPIGDFQKAFYMLFRQSWRARVCPRCKMFFVARRPKQRFCGTVCSAGSRLASKRKWWRSVGTKNRSRAANLRQSRRKVKGANDDL